MLWCLGGTVAWAQAGGDCRPGGTVAETNACAVRDYQQADADLQILYGDVMRSLSAHERPALRQDQSNWQRARMARCKAEHSVAEARPEWPRLHHQCLITQTRGRRAGLMFWLQHGEAPPR
jgi:uncharacterized protein YecT (DUF1311 family)